MKEKTMSKNIYNPLNLNNPVPVDFDDLSDHEPFNDCSGEMGAHYGKTHSPETKLKMSNTRKGKSIHPNGRVFNDEWKQNISNSLKDRTFTDEWKQKISKACKLSHKSGKRKTSGVNRDPLTGKFC